MEEELETTGTSTAEDVKDNSVTPENESSDEISKNLSKAVSEKNRIISQLKEDNEAYKREIEELRRMLEEEPMEEEEKSKSKEKLNELEKKSKELERKVSDAELRAQVARIDGAIDDLRKKYPEITDSDITDLLLEVHKKTGGKIQDMSIFEDFYLAKQAREGKAVANRSKMATETINTKSEPIDLKPKNVHEAFSLLRRLRKK